MQKHRQKLVSFIPNYKIRGILYLFGIVVLLCFVLPYLLPINLKTIPYSSIIYDRNQNEIGEIIYDGIHRHQWLDLNLYPDFLKDNILKIEDKRFFSHCGIDFYSIARAIFENTKSDSVIQGASTIPSQIARNQLWLNEERTRRRKIVEFAYAYVLDIRHSKQELLSYYLNSLPLGYMNYGFETAAQRYFGKSVYQLSNEQQLALITLAKNAVRYDPFKNPENFISRYEMLSERFFSGDLLQNQNLDIKTLGWKDNSAIQQPYIRDFIKKTIPDSQKSPQITTTIDNDMSSDMKDIADQTIYKLQRKNVGDYGVLILDKKTNELRVMLGGMFYDGKAGQVNSTTSINQPGSSVKPFTYVLALKELNLKPNDIIIDEPVQFQSLLGFSYTPQNFSMNYQGQVTIASALAQSLNVPAVKIAEQLGVEKLLDFYHKVGLESLNQPADYYGLALTLGVGEISLWELTRAYGIFAHKGQLCDIISIAGQKMICEDVIEPEYTDMIVDILSNRYNKMPSFPMYSNLDFPDRNVFLKSGTSRKFSDNRVVGFTDNYIIGVRVGNKDGTNMKGVSGSAGAGDIFNNIVYYLEKTPQILTHKPPVKKNESQYLNITKPLPNSLYSIDPAIPSALQAIKFGYSTNIDYDNYQRLLNNKKIHALWSPEIGNYKLTLQLLQKNEIVGEQTVFFDVK